MVKSLRHELLFFQQFVESNKVSAKSETYPENDQVIPHVPLQADSKSWPIYIEGCRVSVRPAACARVSTLVLACARTISARMLQKLQELR